MKHDWQEWSVQHPGYEGQYEMWYPARKCRNCHKVQERVELHSWMRVVGYRWEPLVGCCKPIITKGNKT